MNNLIKIGLTDDGTSTAGFCWWYGQPHDSIASQPPKIGLKLSQGILRYELTVPALIRRPVGGVTFLEPPVPALDVAVSGANPIEIRLSRLFDVAVTGVVHPKVPSNDVPSPAIVKIIPLTGQYDSGECVICSESPQINKSWPPCGHVFCFKCLYHWSEIIVNRSPIDWRCPFCNQLFKTFQQENGKRWLLRKKEKKVRLGFMKYLKLDHFIIMGYIILLPTWALCIYVGIYWEF